MMHFLNLQYFVLVLWTPISQSVIEEYIHIHPKSSFTIPDNISYDSYHSYDAENQAPFGSPLENPLSVEPTILNGYRDWVNISWNFSENFNPHKSDWIGLFNASSSLSVAYASPPISFLDICPMYNNCTTPPLNGTIRVEILNRRTNYKVLYVNSQDIYYREIISISDTITFKNLYIPMNPRITFLPSKPSHSSRTKSVQIVWTQKAVSSPKVQYGLFDDSDCLINTVEATMTHIFDDGDLCDQRYSMPAGLFGYLERHYSISAFLHNLSPNMKIFYRVGEEKYGWSQIYNFTTPPIDGDMKKEQQNDDGAIKFIIMGDGGNDPMDFKLHHSFDFNDHGQMYSVNVTDMISDKYLRGPVERSDFLIHVGDLTYSDGYLSEWDDWLYQTRNILPFIPTLTTIGNHEYSWHGEWVPPAEYVDSGEYADGDSFGECGVVYGHYFPFAMYNPSKSYANSYNPNIVEPWYYFDYGTIRLIVMSTEHDFSKHSKQWFFVQHLLKKTDRTTFPWVIVSLHRPMYSNTYDDSDFDLQSAAYVRLNFESMFKKYKVSLVLSGHEHLYTRTCPVFNETCIPTKFGRAATVNLIVGMAGKELRKHAPNNNLTYIEYGDNTHYGFIHFTVFNKSHGYGKFVDALTGAIVDQFDIINPYRRPWSSLMML